MLFAVASVYLLSCAIEASKIIRRSDHNDVTIYSLLHNMIGSWLAVYAIMKLSKTPDINALWTVSCHAGAVFFALLGQVPWLEDLTLTPGWLRRLSPPAIVVVTIFTLIIIWAGVKQARETCRIRDWSIKAHAYLIYCALYGILFIFVVLKGEDFHFHVHHAIAATLLSLFFTNWRSNSDIIFHGLLMGIAIEGIAFFGSNEAMLFMVKNAPIRDTTLVVAWICIAILGIIWAHITARKQVKIHSIPLES